MGGNQTELDAMGIDKDEQRTLKSNSQLGKSSFPAFLLPEVIKFIPASQKRLPYSPDIGEHE